MQHFESKILYDYYKVEKWYWKYVFVNYFIIPIQSSLVVIKQSNGSLPAQHYCQLSPRSGAWYLFISVHLSLLTKASRWDISAVSPCIFERWFVSCHFELIQYCQQPGISGIASHVFTHPVVSEPCPLCSETIHSSYTEFVRRHGLYSLLNADTWRRYEVVCNYF